MRPVDLGEAVELLDAHTPGWRARIDVDTLHMGLHRMCVLGQLYGDYTNGLVVLGLDEYEDHPWFESSYDVDDEQLKVAWVAELTAGPGDD